MAHCPSCGTRLEYDHDSCPQCLQSLSMQREGPPSRRDAPPNEAGPLSAEDEPVRTIARFANAAEAGFFAHALLATVDVPTLVRVEENFDAVSGYWSPRYLLDVPESIAESASRSLRSLIERSEREDILESKVPTGERWDAESFVWAPERDFRNDARPIPGTGIRWGPIMITLAAGSLAVLGLRTLQQAENRGAEAPAGGRQKELWENLSQPAKPWTQDLDGNRRRELRFNKSRSRATIREYKGDVQTSEKEFALPDDRP